MRTTVNKCSYLTGTLSSLRRDTASHRVFYTDEQTGANGGSRSDESAAQSSTNAASTRPTQLLFSEAIPTQHTLLLPPAGDTWSETAGTCLGASTDRASYVSTDNAKTAAWFTKTKALVAL